MIAMNTEMKALSKQFNESIQLTTIHRAKGLEYKHVYVLSSVDGGLPHDYALEAYRGGDDVPLQEERRLYICSNDACTEFTLLICSAN